MALPGISNAKEFYSAHYLESVLAGDIKKVRERWAEQAKAQLEADLAAGLSNATASTPEAQFKALRKPWQKLREAEIGITEEPAERLRLQRELFFQPLLEALGYPFAPKAEPVLIGGEAYQVPLLGEVSNAKGEPWLWVVECFNPNDEPADPLELTIATRWGCQIDDPSLGTVLTDGDGQGSETWEELISERIFGQEIPPRWVLAVSRDQLLLIDRQKWAASRLLRFELGTLLGENNPDALLAAATLLHREHTSPTGGGTPLLDELDENSHKHAYEVSSDLKYALRCSIDSSKSVKARGSSLLSLNAPSHADRHCRCLQWPADRPDPVLARACRQLRAAQLDQRAQGDECLPVAQYNSRPVLPLRHADHPREDPARPGSRPAGSVPMSRPIPAGDYVEHFDPELKHHRAWLLAVLEQVVAHEPQALEEGGTLPAPPPKPPSRANPLPVPGSPSWIRPPMRAGGCASPPAAPCSWPSSSPACCLGPTGTTSTWPGSTNSATPPSRRSRSRPWPATASRPASPTRPASPPWKNRSPPAFPFPAGTCTAAR
jgi:hypothetical protein